MTDMQLEEKRLQMPEGEVPVWWVESCTSTFDLGWELVQAGRLPVWGAVLARTQQAGRGQTRRLWLSPPGNLYVSFILPAAVADLGDMASLATGWLVQQALVLRKVPMRLKWPNDLVLETAEGVGKAGGILLEERKGALMAGLGLNLCEAPPTDALRADHACAAVALRQYNLASPCELWPGLLTDIYSIFAEQIAGRSLSSISALVEKTLIWQGMMVQAGEAGSECKGILSGLDDQGRLRLRAEDGSVLTVDSGSLRREW